MGLLARIKTWVSTEDVTYSDLNAEFNNILDNLTPSYVDDYSANNSQMQTQTDPGEVGTESKATTLAGEIARLRYVINEMKGGTYWYTTSNYSLESLGTALGGGLPDNRLISGRTRSAASPASGQSIALVPHGAARTVTLKGATTNFIYTIAGTQYTISSDVTLTSLTAAPSTNNTCLVNDTGIADTEDTKYVGEYGSELTVDAMGSEITALTGKLCGFKLNNGGANEYFIARVDSSTKLTGIRRGYFFDSSDAEIPRIAFADNDTITLMKLSWIFAKTDGTLTVSYGNPRVGKDEPVSPASGDYWFDTVNDVWKVYSATTWDTANAVLVGVCLQDSSNTVAARSFDYFKSHSSLNTIEVEYFDATEVRSKRRGDSITVNGTTTRYTPDFVRWDIDTDLDTGVEAASTLYFLYITETGESLISVTGPTYMAERQGLYHPSHMWRCVGQVFNNASSNFEAVISYHDLSETNYIATSSVGSSALTVRLHAPPHLGFKFKNSTITDGNPLKVPILPGTSFVVSSGSTLGTSDATAADLLLHAIAFANRVELAVSRAPHLPNSTATTTAEGGAGAADAGEILYSNKARTSVPVRIMTKLTSTQTTAGTWATAISDYANFPFKYTYAQTITGTSTVVIPSGHTTVELWGSGGGGGGGAGGAGVSATTGGGGGGGGGGGPIIILTKVVTPLDSLTVTIGGGGNGGAGGNATVANNGTAGTSTTIVGTGVSITCPGGGYGGAGSPDGAPLAANGGSSGMGAGGVTSTSVDSNGGGGGGGLGPGGAGGSVNFTWGGVQTTGQAGSLQAGGGGGRNNTGAGGAGGISFLYGTAATAGTSAGAAYGGGGGGGGASWGAGGNGANGSNSGTPATPTACAANSGGGGGGGGGCGTGATANGGTGGNGGSGRVIFYWRVG